MYSTHSNVGIGVPWADSWACQPWRVLGTLPTSLTGTRDETVTRRTDYTNEELILLHGVLRGVNIVDSLSPSFPVTSCPWRHLTYLLSTCGG